MRVAFILTKKFCKCSKQLEAHLANHTFVIRCPECNWSDCCAAGDSALAPVGEFGPVTLARLDGLRFTEYCAKIEESTVPK